jgi:hydroxypyruvate isomerase
MPRFAANLSLMYTEFEFLDRIGAAAADGFAAVECQFPYEDPAADIAQRLDDHGLAQVLINAPPGDFAEGERGLGGQLGREADFRDGIETALAYAHTLKCPRVHVMLGHRQTGVVLQQQLDLCAANLAWAAPLAASAGVDLLLEPLNPRDMPNYLISRQQDAHDIVQQVGAPNLKVQMDLYHCQITEGDLAKKLRAWLPTGRVGHLQIAGVPERHEPDIGEIHHPYLFRMIDDLGWAGWIGAEYRPRAGTRDGLAWFQPYRSTPSRKTAP